MLKQIISHRMYILIKTRWALNQDEAMLLFKSSILCYFDQCDIVYNAARKSDLKQLQNKCLSVVYSNKSWPGTDTAHYCIEF